jgi:hypothetical protein
MMTVPLSMFLIAKAPYPPFGDKRTSKNSVMKRGGASVEVEENECVDEEDEEGVSVGGDGLLDLSRRRRGIDCGEAGGVNVSRFWKDCLEG